MKVLRAGLLAATGFATLATAGIASAEELRQTLERTYRTNPTLAAQRDRLRTLDEGVGIARAGLRPRLSAEVGVNQELYSTGSGDPRNITARLIASYPLFDWGQVRNQIRAADVRVLGGRAALRAVEGDIFTDAVSAYMDVIRDRSIVALNQSQVRVLQTNLDATRDRFEVGDLTRTDVAQSEARLALAQSALATAQGRLRTSEEAFQRVTGAPPGELEPPPTLPPLPQTADQAVEIALQNNPDLRSAAAQIEAAGLDVEVLRADRLPTLDASGSANYTNRLGAADAGLANEFGSAAVGVSATIPIYQGGLVGARVRQASALRSQLVEQAIETERFVVANTRAAFATYRAALDAIESNEVAVAANQLALEGVRAENSVGTRNILDVLNAEQELLNSEVQLVTARRDAYVAGFQLLNAMGRAEAEDLGLDGGPLYDPVVNYNRTVRRANDWNDGDPDRGADSTRTAPANSTSPIAPFIGPVDPRANRPVTQPRQ